MENTLNTHFIKVYEGFYKYPLKSSNEILLLSIIQSFTESRGGYTGSNQWLAERIKTTERTVRTITAHLEEIGLIKKISNGFGTVLTYRSLVGFGGAKQKSPEPHYKEQTIFEAAKNSEAGTENISAAPENYSIPPEIISAQTRESISVPAEAEAKNLPEGPEKTSVVQEISSDNKINNKINIIDKENNILNKINTPTEMVKEVVDYLNQQTGSNYRATIPATQRRIIKWLNQGFTVEDFKKAIDNQKRQWANSRMSVYLRPETLFGKNFESYLNNTEIRKEKPSQEYDPSPASPEKIAAALKRQEERTQKAREEAMEIQRRMKEEDKMRELEEEKKRKQKESDRERDLRETAEWVESRKKRREFMEEYDIDPDDLPF